MLAVASLAALTCTFVVSAQSYPAKPVRIIVPFPAGSGSDVVGRFIAQKLSEQVGQQFFVDNRAGAGGSIGIQLAVASSPDGYTLVLASASEIAVNPFIYTRLNYDTVRDLAPIALLGKAPVLIVVHPSLPVRDVKGLVALARARPGDMYMASAGNGTFTHIAGVMFKSLTGVNVTHVPYKGGSAAAVAVISGEAQVYFAGLPAVASHVKGGRLKAIAVGNTKRVHEFPVVPTVIESGVRDYEAVQWWGIFVPATTSQEIVLRLHSEIGRTLRSADLATNFAKQGVTPGDLSQRGFAEFVGIEVAKWGKIAKTSGVKLD